MFKFHLEIKNINSSINLKYNLGFHACYDLDIILEVIYEYTLG